MFFYNSNPFRRQDTFERIVRCSSSFVIETNDKNPMLLTIHSRFTDEKTGEERQVRFLFLEPLREYLILLGYDMPNSELSKEMKNVFVSDVLRKIISEDLFSFVEGDVVLKSKHNPNLIEYWRTVVQYENDLTKSDQYLLVHCAAAKEIEKLVSAIFFVKQDGYQEVVKHELVAYKGKIYREYLLGGKEVFVTEYLSESGAFLINKNNNVCYSYFMEDSEKEMNLFTLQKIDFISPLFAEGGLNTVGVTWDRFLKYNRLPLKNELEITCSILDRDEFKEAKLKVSVFSDRVLLSSVKDFKKGQYVKIDLPKNVRSQVDSNFGVIVDDSLKQVGIYGVERENGFRIQELPDLFLTLQPESDQSYVGEIVFSEFAGRLSVVTKSGFEYFKALEYEQIEGMALDLNDSSNENRRSIMKCREYSFKYDGVYKIGGSRKVKEVFDKFVSIPSLDDYYLNHEDPIVRNFLYKILLTSGCLRYTNRDDFSVCMNFIIFLLVELEEEITYLYEFTLRSILGPDECLHWRTHFVQKAIHDERYKKYFTLLKE